MRLRRTRGEHGQATVEFAIILPLVLLLIAGLIAFGTAFNYWISLNHLANEGARWTAVDRLPPSNPSPTVAQYKTYITDQVLTEELRAKVTDPATGDIGICFTGAQATPQVGDAATVTIRAEYGFPVVSGAIDLAGKLFGGSTSGIGNVMLTGSSTVRLEQLPSDAGSWTPCPS
jgi:Flp pilus assembly protein TadG